MTVGEAAWRGAALVLRVPAGGTVTRTCDGAGWTTPDHEAERLHGALGGELLEGGAFGRPWPVVRHGVEAVSAPGLPAAVTSEPSDGPDATYDLTGGDVWRTTARGRERVLAVTAPQDPPGRPVDLLWFEDTTRWTVFDGVLEVEDSFSRLTVPVARTVLDRLLVRARRVDPAALEGVPTRDSAARDARLEVWREAGLVAADVADRPELLLGRRPELTAMERRGSTLYAGGLDGDEVVLDVSSDPTGWTVQRRQGRLPFERLQLARVDDRIRLSADLAGDVDGLAPGARQRLAFDLFADLVAAGRDAAQNR
jgi:hypothetical protein